MSLFLLFSSENFEGQSGKTQKLKACFLLNVKNFSIFWFFYENSKIRKFNYWFFFDSFGKIRKFENSNFFRANVILKMFANNSKK